MPLEVYHKNPEVVLTTTTTPRQNFRVRYLRLAAIILLAYILVTYTAAETMILSVSIGLLTVALILLVFTRPRIVLDGAGGKLRIFGGSNAQPPIKIFPWMVEKIRVRTKIVKGSGGQSGVNKPGASLDPSKKKNPNTWYYPQIHLRPGKGRRLKQHPTVDCFELQDIVEAHYVAQLLSAFTNVQAYDVTGQEMPPIKSHIPKKYLKPN